MLNEYVEKSCLDLYRSKYADLKAKNDFQMLKSNGIINLDKLASHLSSLLGPSTVLTQHNSLLVLCLECELVFIDLNSQLLLSKLNLNNQTNSLKYFLSPTNFYSNGFLDLQPIKGTDSLIGLDNLHVLNLIHYSFETKRIQLFSNELNTFDSFVIQNNLLVAFDSSNKQLIGYNLDEFMPMIDAAKNPFRDFLFKVELKESKLKTYGLSTDCKYLYLIENEKILKFFRLDDMRIIAETLLYSPPTHVVCSDEYIALSMGDQRPISFLICDPKTPGASTRIKNLSSRYLK